MTNQFTSFPFKASGSSVNAAITLPDRLAYIKNVRDFGAKGDGVTDDWAAIMAAFNWTTGAPSYRGTIFFPPGTYYVSQPVNVGGVDDPSSGVYADFMGVGGESVITGNFSDYILKRALASTDGYRGNHNIANLSFVNTHPTGGGIRWGMNVGASIRDCIVTANLGINTASDDLVAGVVSQEVSIENCMLSPGSNPTGSIGIMSVSDGPILNCTIIGFSSGMRLWGQQGGQTVMGCRFELCGIGFQPGVLPGGGNGADSGYNVIGCYFLNCGRAIALDHAAAGRIAGVRIESTNAMVFGSTPASGISGPNVANNSFEGIYITGDFSNAGVDLSTVTTSDPVFAIFRGITVNNTGSGTNWKPPTTAMVAKIKACNVGPTYTMAQLPTLISPCSATWSGGIATITTTILNMSPYISAGITFNINVQGMSRSGYNGVFTGAVPTGVSTLTFSLPSDPGGSGTGGNIIINVDNRGQLSANEGDSYNVSDASMAIWGAMPTGGGSTHAKVRWNGSSWTVMGK
jgi:hypothetical protein